MHVVKSRQRKLLLTKVRASCEGGHIASAVVSKTVLCYAYCTSSWPSSYCISYDLWHYLHDDDEDDDTDLLQLLSLQCLCAAGRHFAGTAMNEHSSRSHVIFRIVSHMYLLILSSHCCWFSSTCGNHFHGLKTALEGLGGDVNLDLARFVLNMPKWLRAFLINCKIDMDIMLIIGR